MTSVPSIRTGAPLIVGEAAGPALAAHVAAGVVPLGPPAPAPAASGLAAPQGGPVTAVADSFPSRFATRAYTTIRGSYVDAVAATQLTAAGLKGLRKIEPALDTYVDGDAIVLTWGGVDLARATPKSDDVDDQLSAAADLLGVIRERSTRLQGLSNGLASQGFVAGMMTQLDRYSRAVPAVELEQVRRRLQLRTVKLESGMSGADERTPVAESRAPMAGSPMPIADDRAAKAAPVLAIPTFGESTVIDVRTALEPLARAGATSVILDLRGSTGGLTDVSADTADLFLRRGITFAMRARDPVYADIKHAHVASSLEKMRVVILVDGATASAAESFAAALGDVGRAVIIGRPTLGKGRAQRLLDMPDGEGLFLSVGRFYGPTGAQIDGVGVMPAVCDDGQNDTPRFAPQVYEARRMPANAGRATLLAACASQPSRDPHAIFVAQQLLANPRAFSEALARQKRLAGAR